MDYQNNNNNNLNKSEIKTINKKIVILVVTIFLLITGVAFAYFTLFTPKKIHANIAIEGALNVNFVLSANSNLTLNVDPLTVYNETVVARSVTNTDYAYLQNNSNYDNISCEYEIWYDATSVYHNSSTNTNNDLEFAIIGHDLSGQNNDFVFDLNNVSGSKKMYDAVIYTKSGVSSITQNWEFALEHYNLAVNQNEQKNHSYSGTIYFKEKGCSIITTIASYLSSHPTAGYRGSSHTDNATQNLYRFTGSYQSSDAEYTGNVDNFICLGSDASPCPENNLYRILGVVATDDSTTGLEAGMVKVIKNTSIGDYNWGGGTTYDDTNGTVNTSNDRSDWTCTTTSSNTSSGCFPLWPQSYLNTGILNTNYLNSISNFSDLIASVKWHCFSSDAWGNISSQSEYESALCSSTPTKISLMYAGDYLNSHSNGEYISDYQNKPWLLQGDGVHSIDSGTDSNHIYHTYQWVMQTYRFSVTTQTAYRWESFYVLPDGNFSTIGYFGRKGTSSAPYSNAFSVRPVFYLKNDTLISGGKGTYANPFRVTEEQDNYYQTIRVKNDKYSSQDGTPWAIAKEGSGLRYEGNDPDNYACFKSSCTDDELFRIIGKFNEFIDTNNDGVADKTKSVVKLIKYTNIGAAAWNSTSGGTSNWATATLKNTLNTNWQQINNKAITTRWYLPNSTYTDARIGILSYGDYNYGALESQCSRDIRVIVYSYNPSCFQNNWLYMDDTNGLTFWTINADTTTDTKAYVIGHDSSNRAGDVLYSTLTSSAYVYPTFFIDANNTSIVSGNGSKANPYVIN